MINVLMVNHNRDIVGGGELSMLQLMQGLKRKNIPVSLVVSEEGELSEQARADGHLVHVVPMPPIGLKSLAGLQSWDRFLKSQENISMIHAQTPRAAFYAGVAGRRLSLPSIFHCRVAERDRKLDPILVRLVNDVVCNSKASAARFDAWPWLKPVVIYNGLDVLTAKRTPRLSQSLKLLFVGRLTEEKQPDVAWEVFSALALVFPQLKLTYVGENERYDPELSASLKRKIEQSPYAAQVVWAGVQRDVSPWYADADLVMMPSKHEGFGRVLVEAMAHQVPVVAFRVGGIPEVVENGKQGILIEPYDIEAMKKEVRDLLNDPAKRQKMGEAGPDRAKYFSLESHVQAVIDLYETRHKKVYDKK